MKINYFSKAISLILSLSIIIASFAVLGGIAVNASDVVNEGLVNGDFEDGENGWSVTEGANAGTFKTVNEIQNASHNINITNNAGYFVTGGTDTWLYQGVKLAAGEYTWQFHLDLYGTYNMVGAYTSKSGIGTAAALITADTFKAVNDAGVTSGAFKKDVNDYRISFNKGNYHYTVTYVFTLTEETDVYFAIRGNGGACQYIDNMSLVKTPDAPSLNTELVNGDFETGDLTGFENATDSSIKIVNSAQVSGDATTFTGYAAYMPGGSADTTNTLLQKVKLPAGTYIWSFDVDLVVKSGGWNFLFGVYTDLANTGVGYGSNTSIGTASGTKKSGGSVTNITANSKNGFYISYGNASTLNANLKVEFTLTEETVVYLDIRTAATARSYIDNMTLVKAPNTELVNGDFEKGDLTGFENANGSSIKIVDSAQVDGDAITFKGYAAYMPGGIANTANTLLQKVKLKAGTYVWKFDTDLIITKSGWSFLFGVYTGLASNGVGYGSNKAIGTAYATNSKTGAPLTLGNNNTNGYYISVGNAQTIHATIELKFTIEEETILYFDIRTSANAHSYVDNMILATPIPGDANYDGVVDIIDLVKTKKLELGSGYSFGADFDNSGSVDSDDLTAIRRNILGIVEPQINALKIED